MPVRALKSELLPVFGLPITATRAVAGRTGAAVVTSVPLPVSIAVAVGRLDLEGVGFLEPEADAPAVEVDGDGVAEGGELDDADGGPREEAHGKEPLGDGSPSRDVGDLAAAVESEVLEAHHDRPPFGGGLGPPQPAQYPKI